MKKKMKDTFKEQKGKVDAFLSKHKKTKIFTEYLSSIIITLLMALLFALTYQVFQSPNSTDAYYILPIISGGSSGVARIIALIAAMGTGNNSQNQMTLVFSISYAVVNIPLIYLAFRKIGFRFGLFTTINVVATSLFTNFVKIPGMDDLAKQIACVVPVTIEGAEYPLQAGLLARAFLAGVFSGVASSFSFSCGGSSGGVDTVGYYFSMRKSKNIGRYSVIINSVIFLVFAILNGFALYMENKDINQAVASSILILLFETIFSFVTAAVIDLITRTNKKDQIQIITKDEKLAKLILANVPHGVTTVRSKGAFTGEDHTIIYVTVSTYETKGVIKLVRDADPHSFINVISIKEVYGRFITSRKVK